MLFERQKHLLSLVDALGGSIGNLDFQKLLFLYCQDVAKSSIYEFVPYRFGGFSFTSYADRRRLVDRELLAGDERVWRLTSSGRSSATVPSKVRMSMEKFAKNTAKLRGDALVAEAYRRYPYHATRSEMAERVLADDKQALKAIEDSRPHASKPGLCTIGYEGASVENYLNRLLVDGVTLLCDVRRNPLSRKYGFSKKTLSHVCQSVGIQYEHLPNLGISSEHRQELHAQEDYDALFESYEVNTLPFETEALARIWKWVEDGERVALTCFEKVPHQCHRHCVAEAVEQLGGRKLKTVHL